MSGYLEGLLVLLAINTVFAYGAYLPLAAGQLNIGLAGFAAIGAYGSAYVSNKFAVSPIAAIPIGAVLSGLVALTVAVPVLRTRGIYLALATFALGQITRAAILNLEIIGGAAGYPVTSFIDLPIILAFTIGVVAFVSVLFGTRFGIAVRAVEDDERVADLMGVGVRSIQVAAFTLGAGIAGIGGGLYAHHFSYIEAQYFNVGLSITIVLYVLLGGTQTAWGPFIGATIFTLLPELLRESSSLRYVVFAASVIVLMALRPQGLLTRGQLGFLLDWRQRHAARDAGSLAEPAA
jgi:branched-chain amino acid transport system permease protein